MNPTARSVSFPGGWLVLCLLADAVAAQLPSVADKTKGMQPASGLFTLYRDPAAGRIWLAVDKWKQDFLYVDSLPAGVGSNDIGLDRGKLGSTRVVYFRRVGPKVLLVQRNLRHRATTANPDEKRAVDEAFAISVIHGFDVAAITNDTVLVDATEFALQDAFGVARSLTRSKQGSFKLDPKRSFVEIARCKSFEENTELEATLTFASTAPGPLLREVTATPSLVTVRQRHSLIALPDDGYQPRRFDPRTGFAPVTWSDYAAPISEPLEQQFIRRHRLQKKEPRASISEAVRPIIYYLDPGAPEPVRSALLDGARWWTTAFEAAGFKNAFRVEMLPSGADPMDVRYNVIQWVHRSSRGWSYGNSITDPRTGEIIKGHVSLGSRRVRQDYLIAQALVGADKTACETMALARLRQLSAHEVGHTLGLVHNFAASANDRASVMDYPHPLLRLRDGTIDLSAAYGVGVGEWDIFAIRWGYSSFAADITAEQERKKLDALVRESQDAGLRFLSDRDARPAGGMHPIAHLWDNGDDPLVELRHLLAVRQLGLARFGPHLLADGEPLARLDELFTPLYLLHRYQVEAAAKLVGGADYAIASRGDPQPTTTPVTPERQRAALTALLDTLDVATLTVPPKVARSIPPRTHGIRRDRELLPSRAGMAFDPLTAAELAARHTVRLLLHPQRAHRLVTQHAADTAALSLTELLQSLADITIHGELAGADAAIRRVVDDVILDELLALAANPDSPRDVRAEVHATLRSVSRHHRVGTPIRDRIEHFFLHPNEFVQPKSVQLPPGAPIGCGCGH